MATYQQILQATVAGADSGPFNVYWDYVENDYLIASNISRTTLLAGVLINIPDEATSIIVVSEGQYCEGYAAILYVTPVTTTTTTTTSTTTSTTTEVPTTTTTTSTTTSTTTEVPTTTTTTSTTTSTTTEVPTTTTTTSTTTSTTTEVPTTTTTTSTTTSTTTVQEYSFTINNSFASLAVTGVSVNGVLTSGPFPINEGSTVTLQTTESGTNLTVIIYTNNDIPSTSSISAYTSNVSGTLIECRDGNGIDNSITFTSEVTFGLPVSEQPSFTCQDYVC